MGRLNLAVAKCEIYVKSQKKKNSRLEREKTHIVVMTLNCHNIFFSNIYNGYLAQLYARQKDRALLYLCTHKIQMQLIFIKAANTNKHEILMYPPVVFTRLAFFYLSLITTAHLSFSLSLCLSLSLSCFKILYKF